MLQQLFAWFFVFFANLVFYFLPYLYTLIFCQGDQGPQGRLAHRSAPLNYLNWLVRFNKLAICAGSSRLDVSRLTLKWSIPLEWLTFPNVESLLTLSSTRIAISRSPLLSPANQETSGCLQPCQADHVWRLYQIINPGPQHGSTVRRLIPVFRLNVRNSEQKSTSVRLQPLSSDEAPQGSAEGFCPLSVNTLPKTCQEPDDDPKTRTWPRILGRARWRFCLEALQEKITPVSRMKRTNSIGQQQYNVLTSQRLRSLMLLNQPVLICTAVSTWTLDLARKLNVSSGGCLPVAKCGCVGNKYPSWTPSRINALFWVRPLWPDRGNHNSWCNSSNSGCSGSAGSAGTASRAPEDEAEAMAAGAKALRLITKGNELRAAVLFLSQSQVGQQFKLSSDLQTGFPA